MAALHIHENRIKSLIEEKPIVLIEFWAPWCGDCRRIEKAYDEIADEYSDILTAVKVNTDEFEGIRERENIRNLPTMRLFIGGKAVGQIAEPYARADIEEFLKGVLPEKKLVSDEKVHDMIIIGGGPGGYTAALYAARAGLDVLLIEKLSAGGQMMLTHKIDNYPGFPDGIDGFTLSDNMQKQAEHFGAVTMNAEVRKANLTEKIKRIETDSGEFFSKTVVIATGANPRKLGLPEEEALIGRGVHYCAACDGTFYKDKTVVLVGGGNSAAADALILSRVAKKVYLVHRRDTLRATKIYHEPLMNAENVEFLWDSVTEEILHENTVLGVRIRNVKTGKTKEISADGVFISIGRKPASEIFEGQLSLKDGYIEAGETTETNLPGVYAVGDVRTKLLRQVVTAVADGAVAVHMAEEYLAQ